MLTYNKSYRIREKQPEKKDKDKQAQTLTLKRPDVVDARVYKIKSPFVKFNVYVTLGYIIENGRKRPIEIFINSKDLTHSAQYAVLTRLISAIFRRAGDAHFILEELRSIYDPNGGYFKEGKYIHSFYSEVADVIERFFTEEGILARPEQGEQISLPIKTELSSVNTITDDENDPTLNNTFKICPECNSRALKFENGCEFCVQ
jgi:ribonucleoside-diphosphate reductase alpha chain